MEKTFFKWDQDFQTGNILIDEEHFKLVSIINELLQASMNFENVSMEAVEALNQKLTDYVSVHFANEEGLMEEHSIEQSFIDEHKYLHIEFVKKVKSFFDSSENYDNEIKLSNISEYLIRWLAYHVLNTDKSLVRQIENIVNENMSPKEAYEKELQVVETSTEPLLKALRVLYRLVSDKNKEIEKKNVELEERVIERTRELQAAHDKLEKMSIHDDLTGLPNRRFVMSEIEKHIYEWQRYKVPFSLLFIDVDDFKLVNDQYGHNSGDRVLKWIGEYLQTHTRRNDISCRLGGDEFVVVCAHTNEEEADSVRSKLSKISDIEPLEGIENWQPSLSIGIATIDNDVATASELLQMADKAMYDEKKSK